MDGTFREQLNSFHGSLVQLYVRILKIGFTVARDILIV